MTRTSKIVLVVLAIGAMVIVGALAFFAVGWHSLPQAQRDYLLSRDTPAAAEVQAAVDAAQASNSTATDAAAAQQPPIRVVSPSPIDRIVEKGGTVATPCFEFEVAVESKVIGDGCRVGVWLARGGKAFGNRYVSLELVNDDGSSGSLEDVSKQVLESLAAQMARMRESTGSASPDNRYDTGEGRFLGTDQSQFAGLDTIEMRWGAELAEGVNYYEAGCPEDDPREGAARFEPYINVLLRTVSRLPPGRYVWDDNPQGYLMSTGVEKGCLAPYVHAVRDSLRMR